MKCISEQFHQRDIIVGTTGMLSRELFELRVQRGDGHERDFLTVGGMGHASSIALGIAIQKPNRTVRILCDTSRTGHFYDALSFSGNLLGWRWCCSYAHGCSGKYCCCVPIESQTYYF